MSEIDIKNARIESTMLGIEDHGILTCWISLDYGSSGQGFGGYPFDKPDKKTGKRVGLSQMGTYIRRILEILGVDTWEELPGKHIRVKTDGEYGKIIAIGHIIKDEWFEPGTELK